MTPLQENPAPGLALSPTELALWNAAVALLERNQGVRPSSVLATSSPAFVRLVKTPPKWGIMARCKQTFLVEQLTTERPGSGSRAEGLCPGAGESQGRGAAVRPADKKPRPRSKIYPQSHRMH